MNIWDCLLKRTKKPPKTSDETEELKYEEDVLKQVVVKDLMHLDTRVKMLELELDLYRRD